MIDFSKIQHFAFQSTLSVRRATDGTYYNIKSINISIHALREESDMGCGCISAYVGISIHALREESDALTIVITLLIEIFQSTLSVRRATVIML